jgi:hypothetical protein
MTPNLSIAQAIFNGSMLNARSENFLESWIPLAQQRITGFGTAPTEASFAEALFAQPFDQKYVAIVQVIRPVPSGELRFRFLIVGKELYSWLHDPFAIADRYPAPWQSQVDLPTLEWPHETLPPRTIEILDFTLKNGDGPFLLGGAQTLVDGGKILLARPEPANKLVRDLWTLLPDSTRRTIWPCTFGFSVELGFDVLVMPVAPQERIAGYLAEDQARDYPESRYERNLQAAIEAGDAAGVQQLLARKSTAEMIKLAWWIFAALIVVGIVFAFSTK